ncbi:MAG: hypothetical protein ACOVOJ_06275, partial [Pirellula sp.]
MPIACKGTGGPPDERCDKHGDETSDEHAFGIPTSNQAKHKLDDQARVSKSCCDPAGHHCPRECDLQFPSSEQVKFCLENETPLCPPSFYRR